MHCTPGLKGYQYDTKPCRRLTLSFLSSCFFFEVESNESSFANALHQSAERWACTVQTNNRSIRPAPDEAILIPISTFLPTHYPLVLGGDVVLSTPTPRLASIAHHARHSLEPHEDNLADHSIQHGVGGIARRVAAAPAPASAVASPAKPTFEQWCQWKP